MKELGKNLLWALPVAAFVTGIYAVAASALTVKQPLTVVPAASSATAVLQPAQTVYKLQPAAQVQDLQPTVSAEALQPTVNGADLQ